jgi:WD40 repeat protein
MAAYKDNEFQLLNSPQDGISSVKFAPDTNLLLAASWDETVRLYDGKMNQSLGVFKSKGAMLDTAFLDNTKGTDTFLEAAQQTLLQCPYLYWYAMLLLQVSWEG